MLFKNITFSGKKISKLCLDRNLPCNGGPKKKINLSVWLINPILIFVSVCAEPAAQTFFRKRSLEAFWWVVWIWRLAEYLRWQENTQVKCQGVKCHIACCCQKLPFSTFFFLFGLFLFGLGFLWFLLCLRLDASILPTLVKVAFWNYFLEVDGINDFAFKRIQGQLS